MTEKLTFTGHESFHCRTLWLKKGYEAIKSGTDFNSPEAVVKLGVGKNMVASIRYWMKVSGCLDSDNELSQFARLLLDNDGGLDPFLEDEASLWLLHYNIIAKGVASLYRLAFLGFKREKKEFTKEQFFQFVRRASARATVASDNSIMKDINVFLQTYVAPVGMKSIEEYGAIFIDLGLIRRTNNDRYVFTETPSIAVPDAVLLYALSEYRKGGRTVSVDGLQDLSLIFGLPMPDLVKSIERIARLHSEEITYSDNSGIKNVQFIDEVDVTRELVKHYAR